MKIIISPAKKMVVNTDLFEVRKQPVFYTQAETLLNLLKGMSYEELIHLWKCNDQIGQLNFQRIQSMDLSKDLTPAIISYQGIQYQYMAPEVMEEKHLEYISDHLIILSGFYGALQPFDGVVPYRLEMQSKLTCEDKKNLYDYWGRTIYDMISPDSKVILNLASKEYSKIIEKYLDETTRFVTCIFGEYKNDKVVEKGTYAKMARGEMVRYMAEHDVKDIDQIKAFHRLGFRYEEAKSDEKTLVFVRGD